MILGHALGYLLAFPAQDLRAEHLARTGHGPFPGIAALALVAAGACLIAAGTRALREGGDVELVPTVARLGLVQAPAFLLLELLERGVDPAATVADPGVRFGLAAQGLVAVAVALLLRVVVRSVRVLAEAARPARRRPATVPVPALRRTPVPRPIPHVGSRRRAPPRLLVPERC